MLSVLEIRVETPGRLGNGSSDSGFEPVSTRVQMGPV